MNTYISSILEATWYPDICRTYNDYKVLARKLHPDVNKSPEAADAFTHLNCLKKEFYSGYEMIDESGEYRTNYLEHRWSGNIDLLRESKANYDKIIALTRQKFDASSREHFMQYIPENLEFDGDILTFKSSRKCIPLSRITGLLCGKDRNKHVNWIFSRMIEFTAMMESLGVVHAGINPDSVFIVPETHCIQVATFYHLCTEKVRTISGKYKLYYPAKMFDTKAAGTYIDIHLSKKTALCALGDASGAGVCLRSDTDVNLNVLNYLLTNDTDAFASMRQWRKILETNFIKEFVELKV